jgi:hypothetical protein
MTWASDEGPVVPLPLLSLFRSEAAVRSMLVERHDELTSLLAHVARGREYGVRIFRLDDELRGVLGAFSPSIAALEADVAAAASPGQGYLLNAQARGGAEGRASPRGWVRGHGRVRRLALAVARVGAGAAAEVDVGSERSRDSQRRVSRCPRSEWTTFARR